MASLLQQLENNEAILLMYQAGELPDEDRAEVEQLLATDAGMRAEAQRITGAAQSVMQLLDAGDRMSPPVVSEAVAIRSVSRAMRQWQADRLARQPVFVPKKGLRYPWWIYPTASAASILLAMLVWWGMKPDLGPAPVTPRDVPDEMAMVDHAAQSLTETEQSNSNISDAEQQANTLADSTETGSAMTADEPSN